VHDGLIVMIRLELVIRGAFVVELGIEGRLLHVGERDEECLEVVNRLFECFGTEGFVVVVMELLSDAANAVERCFAHTKM